MGLYDFTLYSIIQRNAKVRGNRTAWVCGKQNVTHKQFLERVDSLAYGLLRLGLKKKDRIAILTQNCLELVYLYGASAKLGTIMLPLNWRLTPNELEYIISDAFPEIIVVGAEFGEVAGSILSKLDFIKSRYSIGEIHHDFKPFDNLLQKESCKEDFKGTSVFSDDGYVMMYTAAVTGKPRGAVLSQRGLIAANLQNMYFWHLTEEDCKLNMLPLFHLADLGIALSVMHAGGTNIVVPKFDPDLALKLIRNHKVTIFCEFPPMLEKLLEKAERGNWDLSCLRYVSGVDDPETVKRFEEKTGGIFWTGYGQTETSGFVSLTPYFKKVGSVGLPGIMAEVAIADEHGNLLEQGIQGEIVVRGPMVFKGYWHRPKDNERTFRLGWHHTGDLGRFDQDGYLWYGGRKTEKELIKSGGENVYPAEIEEILSDHPFVKDVTVIGVPDKQWGEAIKAVVVLKEGKTVSVSELTEFVASRIARYKKPKYIVFEKSLPKTPGGSIDREAVKLQHG